MRLAIPAKWENKEITECEIKRPDSGTLALTSKAVNEQTIIHAMIEYLSGGVEKYIDSSGNEYQEKKDIKSISQSLPLPTGEQLTMQIMAIIHPNEYIRGLYECPVSGCDTTIKVSPQNDNSKSYDELDIQYADNKSINYTLIEPVYMENKKTGEAIFGGQNLVISIPTLKNYLKAIISYPRNHNLQCYDVIINCIESIDGQEVDANILKSWGMIWIKKVDGEDTKEIVNQSEPGGIQKKIDLTCSRCAEEFEGPIDISSFFASGLSKK